MTMDVPGGKEFDKSPEAIIVDEISSAHNDFLQKVPKFDRSEWRPEQAIKIKTGSCMAETLYVAGALIEKGLVGEDDITLGFSKKHGISEERGFFGSDNKFSHVFMLVTTPQETTLECDFRRNRADETPRPERLREDEIDLEATHLLPLARAIEVYGAIDDQPNPTVEEIVDLHRDKQPDNEVRFDQDFQ